MTVKKKKKIYICFFNFHQMSLTLTVTEHSICKYTVQDDTVTGFFKDFLHSLNKLKSTKSNKPIYANRLDGSYVDFALLILPSLHQLPADRFLEEHQQLRESTQSSSLPQTKLFLSSE